MAEFVLPIISGLAGLFGGGKQQQTNTSQNTTSNMSGGQQQQYGSYGSTTPNLNPFQQQLAQLFSQGAMQQYQNGTNLQPYESQGLQQIAGQGNANRQILNNSLAARGLSFSPAAATATTGNLMNTGNQMSNFMAGIPLLQRQWQQQNIAQLMQAFGTQPYGVSTTGGGTSSGQFNQSGSSQMNGTSSIYGNPLGGLFGGLGAGLGALFGGNLFNGLGGGGVQNMPSGGFGASSGIINPYTETEI